MRWISDVLQLPLPQIDKLGRNRSAHMPPGVGGYADTAGRSEAFEPCREVDTMAVDVVRRDDDVTEIDADAQLDASALRHPGIAGDDEPLHIQGAANRVDHAAELDEGAVTGVLDDPAAMFADPRLDDLTPIGEQTEMSALLVVRHQTRIADDIGRKDRRQSPFNTQRLGQAVNPPRPKTPPRQGHPGCDPLDSKRRAAGQQSGDPGFAYVRPKFFQHDPASFDRRDPPGS